MTAVFTLEQAKELIEEEGAVELESLVGKHDCHWARYVVPFNGKMYQFEVEVSYNNGWDDNFSSDPVEVMKITETRIIEKWIPAENGKPKHPKTVKVSV